MAEGIESTTLIAGRNPVREALERGERDIDKVMMAIGASGTAIDRIRKAAKESGVQVQMVPQKKVDHLAKGMNHQGVIALAAAVSYVDFDEMLSSIQMDADQKPILIALDEIEDPHNFGAILRSTVASGAAGAIVPQRKMAPLSATTVRASAGTADRIPVARVVNLAESLFQCKERGYWIAGLDAVADQTIWDADWDRPLVIVIGSEGRGLRPRVRDMCDFLVSIPMPGPAESLNASVAAGITLFAAAKSRL